MPDFNTLKDVLSYDKETGHLVWLISPADQIHAGNLAGYINKDGYWIISYLGVRYKAHRIAWLLSHGSWPKGHIDHVNGVRDDNRIENLRDVTRAENSQNQRTANRRNKLGVLGVTVEKGRFKATIRVAGKTKYLGRYDTPEEAHGAYLEAKRDLHEGCTL